MTLICYIFTSILYYFVNRTIFYFSNASSFQIVVVKYGDSGDLRQGSSNNSVTNFVQGFPYVFQREKQPSFEDLLLVVLVILRRRSATRF